MADLGAVGEPVKSLLHPATRAACGPAASSAPAAAAALCSTQKRRRALASRCRFDARFNWFARQALGFKWFTNRDESGIFFNPSVNLHSPFSRALRAFHRCKHFRGSRRRKVGISTIFRDHKEEMSRQSRTSGHPRCCFKLTGSWFIPVVLVTSLCQCVFRWVLERSRRKGRVPHVRQAQRQDGHPPAQALRLLQQDRKLHRESGLGFIGRLPLWIPANVEWKAQRLALLLFTYGLFRLISQMGPLQAAAVIFYKSWRVFFNICSLSESDRVWGALSPKCKLCRFLKASKPFELTVRRRSSSKSPLFAPDRGGSGGVDPRRSRHRWCHDPRHLGAGKGTGALYRSAPCGFRVRASDVNSPLFQVFVWIGNEAQEEEKTEAMPSGEERSG